MQEVKKFKGKNLSEALAQVKADFGSDAVIMNTQRLKENGREITVITASIDSPGPGRDVPAGAPRMAGERAVTESARVTPIRSGVSVSSGGAGAAPRPAPFSPTTTENRWHREWSEIKSCLCTLMNDRIDMDSLTPRQRLGLQTLEKEGVDRRILLNMFRKLAADRQGSILALASRLVKARPWGPEWEHRFHALAGPFGAGKTTSLIRMALQLKQQDPQLRICLVNADERQGKGRLVLRHYAEIAGFAYREMATRADFLQLVRESGQFDRVLVDLPGLAPTHTLPGQLEEFGMNDAEVAVHLVLSPIYGPEQLESFLERLASEKAASIVWTKLDEACRYGAIVNTADASGLPVSSISCGPGFKGTMTPAESMALWKVIFKHELPV